MMCRGSRRDKRRVIARVMVKDKVKGKAAKDKAINITKV